MPSIKAEAPSMANDSTTLYKNRILTIPNLLSFFRLCLIPIIIWLYTVQCNYLGTLLILVLSAATDIADGIIARKYNMISEFGKAFDPVADKLTQIATLYCLLSRFTNMLLPLMLLIVKEAATGIMSLISIKKTGTVNGAVWHGKLTTVFLYAMMAIHIIWFRIPQFLSNMLVVICIALMCISFILYAIRNVRSIRGKH